MASRRVVDQDTADGELLLRRLRLVHVHIDVSGGEAERLPPIQQDRPFRQGFEQLAPADVAGIGTGRARVASGGTRRRRRVVASVQFFRLWQRKIVAAYYSARLRWVEFRIRFRLHVAVNGRIATVHVRVAFGQTTRNRRMLPRLKVRLHLTRVRADL